MDGNSILYTFDDTEIRASKGIKIGPQARIDAKGTYLADMEVLGALELSFGSAIKVDGHLKIAGTLQLNVHSKKLLKAKPESVQLIKAKELTGKFQGLSEGASITIAGGQVTGTIHYSKSGVQVNNITYQPRKKKKNKNK